jgi:type IV pilus assembly protein PilM
MLRGRSNNVVGLDIEPGYVAAVQAAPGTVSVERAACAQLSSGIVRDGEVVDVESLASVLKELFAEHKLPRRVRLGVANQRIVMRTLDLPPLGDAKQIASAVRFQAQEHIPMPLEQAVLEHQVLGTVETPNGPRTRVVLVAARRDMIDRLLQATAEAGLRPEGIDLSAFAMVRALYRGDTSGPNVYVNVGGITNLAIATGVTCVFTRVIQHGAESLAGELAERRGLTSEHAHAWLTHVGLELPVANVEGDEEIVREARRVLNDGVRRIGDEVRNSLDFYAMQEGSDRVERLVLTGPVISIPGFAEQFGQHVGLPAEVGIVSEARPGGFSGVDAGRLAVATGLTLEEVSR